MTTLPATIDVWLDATTHADNTGASTALRTPHADMFFRFPTSVPAEDKAAVVAQWIAVLEQFRDGFLAAETVPTQRQEWS